MSLQLTGKNYFHLKIEFLFYVFYPKHPEEINFDIPHLHTWQIYMRYFFIQMILYLKL